jgi:hypothetical protein
MHAKNAMCFLLTANAPHFYLMQTPQFFAIARTPKN